MSPNHNHQIGLYPPIVSDLRATLDRLEANGYSCVVTPIVHPQRARNFTDPALRRPHTVFSRSDLVLEAHEWTRTIARVSDSIDVDSADAAFRRHSEQVLQQELAFAEHLNNVAVLIRLTSGRSVNLARTVARDIKSE